MTEKFNKPIGWLVDEGLMLVDPNDKYAIPLYRHPAPRTPTKKMAKDRIEKLEAALCNVTTAWDLWQKTNDSNSFTELFACICEAKALEEKKPLEWTENYGQGSEPWLGDKDV